MESNAEYAACRRDHGEKSARATDQGQAVSYRFKRDDKGWRVFVTTDLEGVPVVTDKRRGAIGIDLNADHLAVAETDASGNYVHAFRVPLVTYGKSSHQAEALIGDAVARVRKIPAPGNLTRIRPAQCLQVRYRRDNRRLAVSPVSFHRLKKRRAESLTCNLTPIGLIPYRASLIIRISHLV